MRLEERGQRYRYLNMVVRDLTDDERGKFKDVVERIVGKVGEEGYEVLGGEGERDGEDRKHYSATLVLIRRFSPLAFCSPNPHSKKNIGTWGTHGRNIQ